MSRRGRALAATPAQVTQVRSLAAEGLSERKIAEIVFGDARYRGRVERLVRPGSSPPAHDSLEGTLLKADEATQSSEPELPSIRELLNRHRRRLASAGELPSLKEIELLLKLERQVETKETLERLNTLTREAK
jgi:hypothetical protein